MQQLDKSSASVRVVSTSRAATEWSSHRALICQILALLQRLESVNQSVPEWKSKSLVLPNRGSTYALRLPVLAFIIYRHAADYTPSNRQETFLG